MTDAHSPLGLFERCLFLWVALCIVVGVGLGATMPSLFRMIARVEYASVNLVVAVLIWIMIYPMMVNVDFASIKDVGRKPKGLCITLTVNWLIKPFTMAAFSILFFKYLFAGLMTVETAKEYIAGMILLGIAPCTAMVFVWSQLVRGDANYTLAQVSINDIIMIFAFAPLAAFLLGATDIVAPWETLLLSVALYVVIPLAAGCATRKRLNRLENAKGVSAKVKARHLRKSKLNQRVNEDRGRCGDTGVGRKDYSLEVPERIARFSEQVKPFSILGLLATVVLLFGLQAQTILEQPFIVGLIAIPLLLQSCVIFFIAYGWAYLWRVPFSVAAPAALISTSNFFELAVAVSISLFGLNSGASLATVVGVLVEVPVMLSLVALANRTRMFFTR